MRLCRSEIFIHPDNSPLLLIAAQEGSGGISYQLRVNFMKKRFASLEWRSSNTCQPFSNTSIAVPGDIERFKRELYFMKIWEWKPSYRKEAGIILEEKYWSVKLKTKGKVYESEGTDCFPENWDEFCKAVERLTGTPFR